ncbi:hypothetical protein [Achromobacter sp. Bel]|uniref:hypothetical protein n=1 Tax=Achromobacter sp. Bel TaxID=2727415 RepID=UPI00145D6ACC|nr:hypothetical protein [Achromobacter sp. Bel]NMK46472.1 hypothetical protein [Achromobacter sp. Bel]
MKTRIVAMWFLLLLAVQPLGTAFGQAADSLLTVSPAMLKRVDQDAEATLLRLYRQSPRAQALIARSFGVLVVPALHADGGILGVAYGSGVLIDALGDRSYYNVIGSPPGSVLGLNDKALILFFSTYESLRAFEATPGWVEGHNGSIQILDESSMANQRSPAIEPIGGFILSANGLASGLSLKGSLFIKVPIYLCTEEAAYCR